jgi:hypothetical protein
MTWEPQEHEFTNADQTTIQVRVTADGWVEVEYFDYATVVTHHVLDHWVDDAGEALYSSTTTRVQPVTRYLSVEAVD